MLRKFTAIAAWVCLIFIIYATLSSAGARPKLTSDEPALVVFVERFGAYALLGSLFCLAYARHIALVCLFILGVAILLEILQLFIPDRDARIVDTLEKLAGGAAGISATNVLMSFAWRRGWKI
jgi:VanZ family protein